MGKRSARRAGHEPRRRGVGATRKQLPQHTFQSGMSSTQFQQLFASFSESVLLCDHKGRILFCNPAALRLFEVGDEAAYRGTRLRQFLTRCHGSATHHQPDSPALCHVAMDAPTAPPPSENELRLHLPSGRAVSVDVWSAPLLDGKEQEVATVVIFQQVAPSSQHWLHLRQVHEAIMALTTAIAALPESDAQGMSEEPLLLSPQVRQVAQPLVDLIRQVLSARRVSLLAVGTEGQLSYLAGGGFSAEQEQVLRATQGEDLARFVDTQVRARLARHQEVVLTSDDLRTRAHFAPATDAEHLLVLPLFLQEQFAGMLTVYRAGACGKYSSEQTELARVLVGEIELLVECLGILRQRIETGTRALVQQEVGRLSADFLTLASHELRTPLTGIMGNLQLAQRRLARIQRLIGAQAAAPAVSLAPIEEPLASAIESARLQERLISEMIETIQEQTTPLLERIRRENLLTLLHEALTRLQPRPPGHRVVLHLPSTRRAIFIRVDRQQIIQVLTTYLINAFHHAAAQQPVTIQVVVTDAVVLVAIHAKEPGRIAADQQALWQYLTGREEMASLRRPNVSLGTGFSVCRMLIEQHGGQVGVQSHPQQGTTFWLTLPVDVSAQA